MISLLKKHFNENPVYKNNNRSLLTKMECNLKNKISTYISQIFRKMK